MMKGSQFVVFRMVWTCHSGPFLVKRRCAGLDFVWSGNGVRFAPVHQFIEEVIGASETWIIVVVVYLSNCHIGLPIFVILIPAKICLVLGLFIQWL